MQTWLFPCDLCAEAHHDTVSLLRCLAFYVSCLAFCGPAQVLIYSAKHLYWLPLFKVCPQHLERLLLREASTAQREAIEAPVKKKLARTKLAYCHRYSERNKQVISRGKNGVSAAVRIGCGHLRMVARGVLQS